MTRRVYQLKDLSDLGLKFCNRHLLRLEAQGKFPRRFVIFEGGRAVGWRADEVDAWLEQRSNQERN